jgi:hypothetical protein
MIPSNTPLQNIDATERAKLRAHARAVGRAYRAVGRACLAVAAMCGGVEIYRAFILREIAPQVTPRSLLEVPRWSRIEGSEWFKPAFDFVLDASLWTLLLIIAAILYAIAIARFRKPS